MEPECSLPHSPVSATCPYPQPARSSNGLTSHFLKIHLNITHPSKLGSTKRSFPSGFPTKILYTPLLSPIRATWPAHFILLDVITRRIVGTGYRSFSSSQIHFYTKIKWKLENKLIKTVQSLDEMKQ